MQAYQAKGKMQNQLPELPLQNLKTVILPKQDKRKHNHILSKRKTSWEETDPLNHILNTITSTLLPHLERTWAFQLRTGNN